ncbi:MAG: hypothetical protein ACU0DI_01110 [Paracoccaceae bacterium]
MILALETGISLVLQLPLHALTVGGKTQKNIANEGTRHVCD